LSCIRCHVSNCRPVFYFSHPVRLYVQDSNFTYNSGLVIQSYLGTVGSEVVFERCFFLQNETQFVGFIGNVTLQSSTVIATNVEYPVFALSMSKLHIINCNLLIHNSDLIDNAGGEVYFSNTTFVDTAIEDSGPRSIMTTFANLTSFTSVNSSFSSTTFYVDKVRVKSRGI